MEVGLDTEKRSY